MIRNRILVICNLLTFFPHIIFQQNIFLSVDASDMVCARTASGRIENPFERALNWHNNELTQQLQQASAESAQYRFRMTMSTMVVGFLATCFAVVMTGLLQVGVAQQDDWGLSAYYSAMIAPFG